MTTLRNTSLRLCTQFVLVSLAVGLGLTRSASADSILVGTDLSGAPTQGGVLCPSADDCSNRAQKFTMSAATVVSGINLVVSGPEEFARGSGTYSTPITVALGTTFPTSYGTTLWTGVGTFSVTDPGMDLGYSEEIQFTGLDVALATGSYFLEVTGGDAAWGSEFTNIALPTTAGSLGSSYACDPSSNCTPGHVDQLAAGYNGAFDLVGSVVTPEPSSLILSGSGLVALCCLDAVRALRSAV